MRRKKTRLLQHEMHSTIFSDKAMNADFAFLDSGTGGIPYLSHLKKKVPYASCVYLADTKNFPYGEKSPEEISECAAKSVSIIIEKWHPKAVVIACNTISVTALDMLRKRFTPVQFIGTVPAIKPAAKISKTGIIGLLATRATINHPYTKNLISEFAKKCRIASRADPELIAFIEKKYIYASAAEKFAALEPAVTFFKDSGCDVIVLACTHFLNIVNEIQTAAGSGIKVIDSREGVAKRALEITGFSKNPCTLPEAGDYLYVTGFNDERGFEEYEKLCSKAKIEFCGKI